MKILYDHQAFTYQNWGGVSKSYCELILNRPNSVDYEISIIESNNEHLRESGLVVDLRSLSRTFKQFHNTHPFLGREKIYNFLSSHQFFRTSEYVNKRESIRKLKEGNFDVFHPTFFDNYFLPYLNGKPFVLTVHDLMPELFGWWKGDSQIANKPVLCEKASAIIAVSENTKEDLCRLYDVHRDKVFVVYHGMPRISNYIGPSIVNSPYFLFVGGRKGYKNSFQTFVDFAQFHLSHPEVKLVCTGDAFSDYEIKTLRKLGIIDFVMQMHVTDEELANLYTYALAFIFPSLYEGFGMPILEAFTYGCPVLLNNKSCFPEIGGNAAIYFDSFEGFSNLALKLEEVYTMGAGDRHTLIMHGFERVKFFSWKKSAERIANIYEMVM